jgi:ring-1,2-phenylacetyl-CoA epoxidase subunit PaaC
MQSKINFVLLQADNALILGHRNSEWCGHGPVLEQDIAISNISLDLIGQARNFYQYAAILKNDGSTEDSFAYYRDDQEFKNILLVEQPNNDWAHTILRQFFFSTFQQIFFEKLSTGKDAQLAAIATKSLKEIAYHLRWSSEWVIRLGDGTEESHDRMKKAIDSLWVYTEEMFTPAGYEISMVDEGVTPDIAALSTAWLKKVKDIFDEATLTVPASSTNYGGGKDGVHSPHLAGILNELQSVARAYPGSAW